MNWYVRLVDETIGGGMSVCLASDISLRVIHVRSHAIIQVNTIVRRGVFSVSIQKNRKEVKKTFPFFACEFWFVANKKRVIVRFAKTSITHTCFHLRMLQVDNYPCFLAMENIQKFWILWYRDFGFLILSERTLFANLIFLQILAFIKWICYY